MDRRERVLQTEEYWFQDTQLALFKQVKAYMKKKDISQTELAEELRVNKSYVSQILNGSYNYTLKKWIGLSLAIGLVPKINYIPIEAVLKEDADNIAEKKTTFQFDENEFSNEDILSVNQLSPAMQIVYYNPSYSEQKNVSA